MQKRRKSTHTAAGSCGWIDAGVFWKQPDLGWHLAAACRPVGRFLTGAATVLWSVIFRVRATRLWLMIGVRVCDWHERSARSGAMVPNTPTRYATAARDGGLMTDVAGGPTFAQVGAITTDSFAA